MGKTPAFQFYPGDWLRSEVAGCSISAQGLWLRLLMVMHDCDRYGIDLATRAKHANMKILDYADTLPGVIDILYSLAHELFPHAVQLS